MNLELVWLGFEGEGDGEGLTGAGLAPPLAIASFRLFTSAVNFVTCSSAFFRLASAVNQSLLYLSSSQSPSFSQFATSSRYFFLLSSALLSVQTQGL